MAIAEKRQEKQASFALDKRKMVKNGHGAKTRARKQ